MKRKVLDISRYPRFYPRLLKFNQHQIPNQVVYMFGFEEKTFPYGRRIQ